MLYRFAQKYFSGVYIALPAEVEIHGLAPLVHGAI
jgi:hypothetical protein